MNKDLARMRASASHSIPIPTEIASISEGVSQMLFNDDVPVQGNHAESRVNSLESVKQGVDFVAFVISLIEDIKDAVDAEPAYGTKLSGAVA